MNDETTTTTDGASRRQARRAEHRRYLSALSHDFWTRGAMNWPALGRIDEHDRVHLEERLRDVADATLDDPPGARTYLDEVLRLRIADTLGPIVESTRAAASSSHRMAAESVRNRTKINDYSPALDSDTAWALFQFQVAAIVADQISDDDHDPDPRVGRLFGGDNPEGDDFVELV